MSGTSDMPPVIVFGILSLLIAVLGLHYRDSLCCLCLRSLIGAWFPGPELDIEAMAGMQHGLRNDRRNGDDDSIELQPRSHIPLYFDSTFLGRNDPRTSIDDRENTLPTTPMDG